jgi:Immunoglobulin-like domain of bacterial spore germination
VTSTDDDRHHELHDLLTDAVADVEPTYRLDVIRARTQRRPFRGWYAAGAAVLAAASVVTGVAVVNGPDHGPVPGPTTSEATRVTALYFVGDTPTGPRLYREWQLMSGGPLAALQAITEAQGPDDPDYTTVWPKGEFTSVSIDGDSINVGVDVKHLARPGFTRAERGLFMQQVVYTVQAAVGQTLPVEFSDYPFADAPGSTTISIGSIGRAPENEVLSPVSISDPAEGTRVSGSFVARGRANSFEATVPWQIRRGTDELVAQGSAMAEGTGDHLYAWETKIDVSDLTPGTYTFVAMTDDPSAEGPGPTYDTRTIIIE